MMVDYVDRLRQSLREGKPPRTAVGLPSGFFSLYNYTFGKRAAPSFERVAGIYFFHYLAASIRQRYFAISGGEYKLIESLPVRTTTPRSSSILAIALPV